MFEFKWDYRGMGVSVSSQTLRILEMASIRITYRKTFAGEIIFLSTLDTFLLPFFLFHLLTIRSVLFFLSREIKRRDNHTWVKSFNECLVPGFQAMSYLCRDCSSDAQLSGTVGRTSPVGVICLGSTLNPTLASTSASNGNVKCVLHLTAKRALVFLLFSFLYSPFLPI